MYREQEVAAAAVASKNKKRKKDVAYIWRFSLLNLRTCTVWCGAREHIVIESKTNVPTVIYAAAHFFHANTFALPPGIFDSWCSLLSLVCWCICLSCWNQCGCKFCYILNSPYFLSIPYLYCRYVTLDDGTGNAKISNRTHIYTGLQTLAGGNKMLLLKDMWQIHFYMCVCVSMYLELNILHKQNVTREKKKIGKNFWFIQNLLRIDRIRDAPLFGLAAIQPILPPPGYASMLAPMPHIRRKCIWHRMGTLFHYNRLFAGYHRARQFQCYQSILLYHYCYI